MSDREDRLILFKLKRLNNIELERMDHVDDGREARKRGEEVVGE